MTEVLKFVALNFRSSMLHIHSIVCNSESWGSYKTVEIFGQ